MPEGSKDGVKTVANTGTGFSFGRMDYDKPGTYVYTVTEQAGRDPTIGYSTQAYDVTVTVTDQGGMLSASVDRQATDVRFDNTYTPTPVDVTVKADKHLAGRDLNDGEFAAELKDSDGNLLQTKRFARVPRDAQSDKATDVREGEGTLEFDKLTFDRAGVYTYTVTEQDAIWAASPTTGPSTPSPSPSPRTRRATSSPPASPTPTAKPAKRASSSRTRTSRGTSWSDSRPGRT